MIQKNLRGFDLYFIIGIVILSCPGKIVLVFLRVLRLRRNRHITFRLSIGDLHLIAQQILGEQPGSQNLLGVLFIENTDGRPLRNHLRILRIVLRNLHDLDLKIHQSFFRNIHQRRVASHPGGSRRGIYGKDTLARVQKIGRITGDLERGKGSACRMLCRRVKNLLRRAIENLYVTSLRGITCPLLLQHLNHHVVRGLVDKGNHDVSAVQLIGAIRILLRGSLRHLPDKIPGQRLRQRVAQRLYVCFIDIAGFCGTHVGHRVISAFDGALFQELRHNLLLCGSVKQKLASTQTVFFIRKQIIQRDHHVFPCHISRDMVRIGDAHVRRGSRGNVCDDVIIDIAVIRIKAQIHRNIRVQLLKVGDRLLIDLCLIDIRIVFRPECNLIISGGVKALRHRESGLLSLSVAAGKKRQAHKAEARKRRNSFPRLSHPFIPPLDTPSIIFFRNTRNRMISGTEMTTTAAIMAGIFSRPKPFSRISWIPFETR